MEKIVITTQDELDRVPANHLGRIIIDMEYPHDGYFYIKKPFRNLHLSGYAKAIVWVNECAVYAHGKSELDCGLFSGVKINADERSRVYINAACDASVTASGDASVTIVGELPTVSLAGKASLHLENTKHRETPITRYDYDILLAAAIAGTATQSDIDALGEWFSAFGDDDWNGEKWSAYQDENGHHYSLRPIYKEIDEDIYEIDHYELE